MAYTPITWEEGKTPLSADNLNHMEQGILDAQGGGSGGSTVEVDQVLTSGTEIGGVTVDDERTPLYAPSTVTDEHIIELIEEHGGGSEEYELIDTITFSEETTSITKSFSKNYKKLLVAISSPSLTTNRTIGIPKINNIGINYFTNNIMASIYRYFAFEFDCVSDAFWKVNATKYSVNVITPTNSTLQPFGQNSNSMTFFKPYGIMTDYINQIQITTGTTAFLTDCTILMYGVAK